MPIFKAIYKKLSKKWHPQAITVGAPVEMDELCKHIARMSTVSIPDAKAAIEALGIVMGDLMNAGRSVHVDGLGTFYYTCVSNGQGVDAEEKVNANQITGTRVRFVPESSRKGNTITRALISDDLVWTNIKYVSDLDGTGTSAGTPGTGEDGDDSGQGTFG